MPLKAYRRVALGLLLLAVPLFLITTNLNIVINSGWLYTFGFERHGVAARAVLEPPELRRISEEIKDYFNNDAERLDVVAVVDGQERPLFNEREIVHMVDVKGLVRGVSFWQLVALFTMLGVFVTGLALGGRALLGLLARGVLAGSALTIAIFAVAGVGALIGFDALFERFHLISFSNDFWILDPSRDYLLRIFPEGFFLDATLIIAGLTIGQAALASAVAGGYLWRQRAVERRRELLIEPPAAQPSLPSSL